MRQCQNKDGSEYLYKLFSKFSLKQKRIPFLQFSFSIINYYSVPIDMKNQSKKNLITEKQLVESI